MTEQSVAPNWGDWDAPEGEWDQEPRELWAQGRLPYSELSLEDQEIINRTLSLNPEQIAAFKSGRSYKLPSSSPEESPDTIHESEA